MEKKATHWGAGGPEDRGQAGGVHRCHHSLSGTCRPLESNSLWRGGRRQAGGERPGRGFGAQGLCSPLSILPPQQANPFHSINTPAGQASQRPLLAGAERPSQGGRGAGGRTWTNTVTRPSLGVRNPIRQRRFCREEGAGGDPQGGRFTFQTESPSGNTSFPPKEAQFRGGSNTSMCRINTLRPGQQGRPADRPLRAGPGDPGEGSRHVLAGPLQPTPLGPR